jgi:hypothetical protein
LNLIEEVKQQESPILETEIDNENILKDADNGKYIEDEEQIKNELPDTELEQFFTKEIELQSEE